MFAVTYIDNGGEIRLNATGFFYALLQTICGSVPPCGALMRPLLPLCMCKSTGKAEPFFFLPTTNKFYL